MTPEEIVKYVTTEFSGVVPKSSWGETSLFYNPDNILPNGVYFCTIKEQDGENDKTSNLNRESVFRLSLGVGKENYRKLFGDTPKRPAKGEAVALDVDFTELDVLTPHPVYAWMGWVCINSPSKESFQAICEHIESSYTRAVANFDKNKKVKEYRSSQ